MHHTKQDGMDKISCEYYFLWDVNMKVTSTGFNTHYVSRKLASWVELIHSMVKLLEQGLVKGGACPLWG